MHVEEIESIICKSTDEVDIAQHIREKIEYMEKSFCRSFYMNGYQSIVLCVKQLHIYVKQRRFSLKRPLQG